MGTYLYIKVRIYIFNFDRNSCNNAFFLSISHNLHSRMSEIYGSAKNLFVLLLFFLNAETTSYVRFYFRFLSKPLYLTHENYKKNK